MKNRMRPILMTSCTVPRLLTSTFIKDDSVVVCSVSQVQVGGAMMTLVIADIGEEGLLWGLICSQCHSSTHQDGHQAEAPRHE
jgi:hypothetical protein